jgi:hypothetical protein
MATLGKIKDSIMKRFRPNETSKDNNSTNYEQADESRSRSKSLADSRDETKKLPEDSYELEEVYEEHDYDEIDDIPQYSYLDDTGELLNEEPDIDFSRPFVKGLCLFYINKNLAEPFLQFLFLNKENNNYTFPFEEHHQEGFLGGGGEEKQREQDLSPEEKHNIEPVEIPLNDSWEESLKKYVVSLSKGVSTEEIETNQPGSPHPHPQYLNESFHKMASAYFLFPDKDENDTTQDDKSWKKKYKGYIEFHYNDKPYYIAFVDCTDLVETPSSMSAANEDSEMIQQQHSTTWGIVDEIIERRTISDITIDPTVTQLFLENPFLKYIVKHTSSVKEHEIPIPYSLYLCVKNEKSGELDNSYYEEGESPGNKSISIFNNSVIHNVFGFTHLFSKNPLNYDRLENIKRYAVSINDPVFIMNRDRKISEIEYIKNPDNIEQNIYFIQDDGMAFWSIKDANSFIEIL